MADFLALMGDAVDNIPGVPGVGRKTAATLLKHFDSLPGVYENIAAVPKLKFRGATFVAQTLAEHRESAFLSRQLTGIACDMPLDAQLDDLQSQAPDLSAVDSIYERLGFGRLLREQARRLAARRS
jgi:5'-3' exonuclease